MSDGAKPSAATSARQCPAVTNTPVPGSALRGPAYQPEHQASRKPSCAIAIIPPSGWSSPSGRPPPIACAPGAVAAATASAAIIAAPSVSRLGLLLDGLTSAPPLS